MRISIPGVGGSLGQCPVCGETFLKEIVMGENCITLKVHGIAALLYVHNACLDKVLAITDGDWRKLPPGPLRTEFEEAHKRMTNEPVEEAREK